MIPFVERMPPLAERVLPVVERMRSLVERVLPLAERVLPFVVLAGLLAGAAPGRAHHSFSAHYDIDVEVTLEGVVTDYRFINPHVLVFLDVTTPTGEVEEWIAETNSPSLFLRRGGLRADSLRAGDAIRLAGHPSRAHPNDLHISLIVFPDGTEFRRNPRSQGQ